MNTVLVRYCHYVRTIQYINVQNPEHKARSESRDINENNTQFKPYPIPKHFNVQ